MTKIISALVALVSRKPSTEKAISGITKALDHLDAVVAHENKELDRLEKVITKTATKRLDAFTRRDRAAQVSKRFADLVA